MSEVKVETLEENFDQILQLVGEDSFVDWDSFTKSSSEATKAIDELTKALTIYREAQHRTFIQVMKKLKSYDIPDIIKTVKAKKLPREVLRSILSRFKLTDGKLELSGTVAELKEGSAAEFEEYRKGSIFRSDKLKEFTILLNGWIQ